MNLSTRPPRGARNDGDDGELDRGAGAAVKGWAQTTPVCAHVRMYSEA